MLRPAETHAVLQHACLERPAPLAPGANSRSRYRILGASSAFKCVAMGATHSKLISSEYLSVGHPPYFTGLDYIYEDRGEVLNIRFSDHGENALIAWAGIPTSPAWLPTYMLIKADRLSYKRQ